MEDMRLLEAMRDLRRNLEREVGELRREVREDLREVRESALKAHLGLIRRLLWTVTILGLALGGKELVMLALGGAP